MLGVQEAIAVASWTPPGQRKRVRWERGWRGREGYSAVDGYYGLVTGDYVNCPGCALVGGTFGHGLQLAGPSFVPDVGRTCHRRQTGTSKRVLHHCILGEMQVNNDLWLSSSPCIPLSSPQPLHLPRDVATLGVASNMFALTRATADVTDPSTVDANSPNR